MKDLIGPALVKLESVGSLLDIDTLDVYPCMEDDTPDWECGTELDNINIEWWMNLSLADIRLLQDYKVEVLPMVISLLTCEVGDSNGGITHTQTPKKDIIEVIEQLKLEYDLDEL